jgi:hypothetical protein
MCPTIISHKTLEVFRNMKTTSIEKEGIDSIQKELASIAANVEGLRSEISKLREQMSHDPRINRVVALRSRENALELRIAEAILNYPDASKEDLATKVLKIPLGTFDSHQGLLYAILGVKSRAGAIRELLNYQPESPTVTKIPGVNLGDL